jgi:chemotaxis methyl-accepting protein methylase
MKQVLIRPCHENELMFLLRKVLKAKNMDCTNYKSTTLKRRLERRLFATKCTNYSEYGYYLDKHPEEYDAFLDDLTINVTDFFRDKTVFDFLQKKVLPVIIDNKETTTTKRIRIWSAGCAGGEEPYSLAILLCELLGRRLKDFNISIWGTDVDDKSLEQARKGEYDEEMVSRVPPLLLNKYFDYRLNPDMPKTRGAFKHNRNYRVKEEIRNLVRFRRHDLVGDNPMKCFDIIVCRNTLIYFTREFQTKLFQEFHDGLNSKGYLVLGKSEMPTQEILPRLHCVSKNNCVYRKK